MAPRPTNDRWTTRELSRETWPDFEAFFARFGGVQAGCWCMYYRRERPNHAPTEEERIEQNRKDHRRAVHAGTATGILVYAGTTPVGWCQFDRREHLPRFDAGRKYQALVARDRSAVDWRISCFFVDPTARRTGVTEVALRAALAGIARRGGGVVEAFPTTNPRAVASWFGSLGTFRRAGFRPVARFGASHVVVRRRVLGRVARAPSRAAGSRRTRREASTRRRGPPPPRRSAVPSGARRPAARPRSPRTRSRRS